MRVPREIGLQRLQDLYQQDLPTEFQLTLTLLETNELPPNDEGVIGLAVARYGVSLNRSGCTLVTLELEDIRERSNVQDLIELMEEVNGEYCFVGEVRKIVKLQFATGLSELEMIEVADVLANLLQSMSETVLMQQDQFLSFPTAVQSAWLREYAFTEKSKPIRQVEHEGVRWFRFDDPMSWSAW
jgi:hypothetical protein